MDGPEIVVRSMSVARPRGPSQAMWQYHSRSDHHSKVACWAATFDMLQTSALLREHAATRKVIFGINFEMSDFQTGRKKVLDLVVARRAAAIDAEQDFETYAEDWGIQLTRTQRDKLHELPALKLGSLTASGVLVALEAKAAMTAHIAALPRLYDELNSSQLAIHGSSEQALAIGLVMVNAGPTFVSPVSNEARNVTNLRQPEDANGVIEKIEELPRRSGSTNMGFDGLGVLVVEAANDGTPVELVDDYPLLPGNSIFNYRNMITRVCSEYDSRFARI